MALLDALTRAIKEYEGGVVIISHDFRTLYVVQLQSRRVYTNNAFTSDLVGRRGPVGGQGLGGQGLGQDNITIVDYKNLIVKNSASPCPWLWRAAALTSRSCSPMHRTGDWPVLS